jgi:hypothetical protein
MLLYHWTTESKAKTALAIGKLKQRKWQNYLEKEQRFAKGSSWSEHPTRWQSDNPVCLVIDGNQINNPLHAINGNRTYYQTMGMTKSGFDPHCYLFVNEYDGLIYDTSNVPEGFHFSFRKLAKYLSLWVVSKQDQRVSLDAVLWDSLADLINAGCDTSKYQAGCVCY